MTKFAAAAAAFLLASWGAHAQPLAVGQSWPPVGPWRVMAMPDRHGAPLCAAMTVDLPGRVGSYGVGIRVAQRDTTLHLTTRNGPPISAQMLGVLADGSPVTYLSVISLTSPSPGATSVVANLPGDTLVRRLYRPLANANTMTLVAGRALLDIPVAGFRQVEAELADCARRVQTMTGWIPPRN